jgi:hypothetical protein
MKDIVSFGSSHWHALRVACSDAAARSTLDIDIVHFDVGLPRYQPFVTGPSESPQYNSLFLEDIRNAVREIKPQIILSFLAGSDWITQGIVRHAHPYDFVLPSEPTRAIDLNADCIPYDALRSIYLPNSRRVYSVMQHFGKMTDAPIFHFSAPPPIRKIDVGRTFETEPKLRAAIQTHGLTPASLRYKLWRTHTLIVKEVCIGAGCFFVEPPTLSQDEEGFLLESYCSDDFIHANHHYGNLLIAQIRTLFPN